jgi:hypothetical protein
MRSDGVSDAEKKGYRAGADAAGDSACAAAAVVTVRQARLQVLLPTATTPYSGLTE